MLLVAQELGHFCLHIKRDALFGTAGHEVEFAPHGPEEIFCLAEEIVFLL